jgi:hypothetical protein
MVMELPPFDASGGDTLTWPEPVANPGSSSLYLTLGDFPAATEVVLDADGIGEVAIAAADTYRLVAVTFAEASESVGSFDRIDSANTTHIRFQCQAGGLTTEGKTVVVKYEKTLS